MISLGSILTEGKYDSLVTKLSRELLTVIKQSYSAVSHPRGEFAGAKIFYRSNESRPEIYDSLKQREIYFTEVENTSIPVEFYLELRIQWVEGLGDLLKGGDAYNDSDADISDDTTPPLIEIRFEIDPATYPNILSKIAMELRDTLRHEVEHITQSGWNLKSNKFIPNDMSIRSKIETGELPPAEYFVLPKEVDANLQGLYLYAKKTKQPLKLVVSNYLDKFVTNGMITGQDKNNIIAVWNKRLPALAIKQEI
jgi:hypothetical protein